MAKWEMSDVKEDDTFDLFVEVGFKHALKPKDVIEVMRIFLNTTTEGELGFLFEGVISFSIDQQRLLAVFNFYSPVKPSADLKESAVRENVSKMKVQAIFHLFAKIDEQHRLDDTPFPHDFREFLHITDS